MESDEEYSNGDSLPSQHSHSACPSFHNSNCVIDNLGENGVPKSIVSPSNNVRRSASGVLRCDDLSDNVHSSPTQQPCYRGEYETDSIFQEDGDPFNGYSKTL